MYEDTRSTQKQNRESYDVYESAFENSHRVTVNFATVVLIFCPGMQLISKDGAKAFLIHCCFPCKIDYLFFAISHLLNLILIRWNCPLKIIYLDRWHGLSVFPIGRRI
jgi:hypothetical protein